MSETLYSILVILIPFIGTSLGSFFVFFLKKNIGDSFNKVMIGFASGVMLAASVWSLIIPSVEMAKDQKVISWLPASVGLLFGVFFLIMISYLADKIRIKNNKNMNMLLFSVTLHNIPEGMAVGVCVAGAIFGINGMDFATAMLLSIGIAVQNIPEGAIISMPLKMEGKSKTRSFIYGVLSGVVEPIAAVVTILLLNIVVPMLPYLLSFAAGAMIYVVVAELVPEMHGGKKSNLGIIWLTIGFIVMMILDIALG